MAFDVSGLSAYTNQQKFPLLYKSMFDAKTQSLFTMQQGIKSADTLNIMDSDVLFQTGGTCSFTGSGTTSFTQRTLTVKPIKIHEALCQKTLEGYYLQTQLPRGSMQEVMAFEETYTALKTEQIAQALEVGIWMGDTTLTGASNTNYNKFDGQLKLIDAASGVVSATAANTVALTASNIVAKLNEMAGNIPSILLGKRDFVIFVGWDVFRIAVTAFTTANMYHFDPGNAWTSGEYIIPGTNIKLIAVHGLDLANVPTGSAQSTTVQRMIGGRLSNFFVGTDMEHEEEKFEIFYAKEAMEIRFVDEFKFGTQFAFPKEIIQYGK